jgi:hypothetical protein
VIIRLRKQRPDYGTHHRRTRADLAAHVATGAARCVYCHQFIQSAWDLAHYPDGTSYLGPAHVNCNRGHKPLPR